MHSIIYCSRYEEYGPFEKEIVCGVPENILLYCTPKVCKKL
jgi:hypothetical protein